MKFNFINLHKNILIFNKNEQKNKIKYKNYKNVPLVLSLKITICCS